MQPALHLWSPTGNPFRGKPANDAMAPLSYRSPKTIVRESPIHGRGLFARTSIARGEIVAVKGGHIISREVLQELQPTLGPAEIQIADDLFIGPVTEEEREGSMIFSNHSCEPNLGLAWTDHFRGDARDRGRRRIDARLGDDRR